MNHPRPAFEPHTRHMLDLWRRSGLAQPLSAPTIAGRREPVDVGRDFVLRHTGLEHRDITIDGPDGALTVALLRRPGAAPGGPLTFWFHGGGLVMGNRFSSVEVIHWLLETHGGVIVSPEYRLAPEHPAPAGMEDCYATYRWGVEHADELGVDVARTLITGMSGGGNLALAVALAA
ncbi:MAG: alpha/beta hydrolase, partial [Propionibacterium sp.]|nr:alpha/beta hydrolase [Propionibacterium sp.]